MLHRIPLLSNNQSVTQKVKLFLSFSVSNLSPNSTFFDFLQPPLSSPRASFCLESDSCTFASILFQFKNAGNCRIIRFFLLNRKIPWSGDFWQINLIFSKIIVFGSHSPCKMEMYWFCSQMQCILQAEWNWRQNLDFLVPGESNRVNFWTKVGLIEQVLRGITWNLSDGSRPVLFALSFPSSRPGLKF